MKLVAAFLLASSASAACLIQGTVVDAASGRPVVKAQVFAKPEDWHKPAILRESDSAGGFCFERLEKIAYTLVVSRNGYLPLLYGALPGRDNGAIFRIADDAAIPPVTAKLLRPASLAGTVVDSDGQPLENAAVELLHKVWDKGWTSDSTDSTGSDDHGAFRFSRLPPGTYYLSVQPRGGPQAASLDERGKPLPSTPGLTFYAGAFSFAHATAIPLTAGQEMTNLVVAIAPEPVRTFSGRISSSVEPAANAGRPVDLSLWTEGSRMGLHEQTRGDGTFSVSGLEPRKYTVNLSGADFHYQFPIDLTDGDVAGFVIEPPKKIDLRMTVTLDGRAAWGELTIRAQEKMGATESAVNTGGALRFRSLPAGVWHFSGYGDGMYLKSLLVDGKPRPDCTLDLRGDAPAAVEAVMSRNVAKVEGHLAVAESAKPSLAVTVIWMDRWKSPHEPGESKSPDQTGKFTVESLAPGRYSFFAIEGFDEDLWGSPELMAALADKSLVVDLQESETKEIHIPVISLDEWIGALRKAGM